MTPSTADHSDMSVEDFEELARSAPETVTLELINGKLRVKPAPDGNHGEIFMWLMRQCMQHRPDLNLMPERGLKVEKYRNGRARADGALAPRGYFKGHGEWSSTDSGVLMAVEITSHDADTHRRDRIEKPVAYAEADIPVYLLIDRDSDTLTVYSEPKNGAYQQSPSYPYGAMVELPAPVGFTLDTEELKHYTD
jgi:Uma2 family endonuclease